MTTVHDRPTTGLSSGEYAYEVLRRRFSEMLARESGTRQGEDPEQLHQMRVACRRLRTGLRFFGALLPPELAAWQEELGWLSHTLGDVRDLDVELIRFAALEQRADPQQQAALQELSAVLREKRSSAQQRLVDACASQRFEALVRDLAGALSQTPPETQAGQLAAPAFVGPQIRRAFRKFCRQASRLKRDSSAADYHQTRRRAKRLRYVLEYAAELDLPKTSRAAKALKATQDLLGEHQDLQLANQRFRALVHFRGDSLSPATLLCMGEMSERNLQRLRQLRRQWPQSFTELRRGYARLKQGLPKTA